MATHLLSVGGSAFSLFFVLQSRVDGRGSRHQDIDDLGRGEPEIGCMPVAPKLLCCKSVNMFALLTQDI